MVRLHSVFLATLLFGTVFAATSQRITPQVHRFSITSNAASLSAVDAGVKSNPSHSVVNRATNPFSGPQYLPPVERKLICTGGQVCVSKYVCRGGTFTADLSAAKKECIPDSEVCCTYRPPPPPPPPKPTLPPSTPCTGRFQACVPPQQCVQGLWKANGRPQPAYATRCSQPDVCCRIPDPESTSLTNNGYVVRVPQNQLITPTRGPVYLPPVIRGESQLSLPINPPPKNAIDDPTSVPVICAAALNCTAIEYCTATGVISKTPVSLTPEQEAYRVPLTDCLDPVKGINGKCCRDPDYVDPWPVSQLGQYVDPKAFGDDGQYRP